MSIRVGCSDCDHERLFDEELRGRAFRCPQCKKGVIRVPKREEDEEKEPDEEELEAEQGEEEEAEEEEAKEASPERKPRKKLGKKRARPKVRKVRISGLCGHGVKVGKPQKRPPTQETSVPCPRARMSGGFADNVVVRVPE